MQAHRDAEPLPMIAPGVPLALARLVHGAMVKDPTLRPTAMQLRDALAPHAAAAPIPEAASEPEASTIELVTQRSRLRDLAGWVRYGRWRWRPA